MPPAQELKSRRKCNRKTPAQLPRSRGASTVHKQSCATPWPDFTASGEANGHIVNSGTLFSGADFRTAEAQNDRILGDAAFLESMERHEEAASPAATVDDIVAAICSRYGTTEKELAAAARSRQAARARAEIALEVQSQGAGTVAEIARRFNRSQTALCHSMARLRRKRRSK